MPGGLLRARSEPSRIRTHIDKPCPQAAFGAPVPAGIFFAIQSRGLQMTSLGPVVPSPPLVLFLRAAREITELESY